MLTHSMFCRAAALTLGVMLVTAGPPAFALEDVLERSDEGGIVFRVRFDDPVVTTVSATDGATYQSVTIPGTAFTETPGWPEVPAHTVLVGIPPGAIVTGVSAEGFDVREVSGAPVSPTPTAVPDPQEPRRLAGYRLEPDWSAAGGAWYPSRRAELVNVSWARNRRVAAVRLHPIQTRPGESGFRFTAEVRVRIELAPARVAAATKPLPVPFGADPWDAALDERLVNGPQSRGWLRSEAPSRSYRGTADYFSRSTNWVRVRTGGEGIVRVTGASLQAATGALPIADPASIRVFMGALTALPPDSLTAEDPGSPPFMTEVSIVVEDGGDGRLDATSGDRVEFFSLPVDGFPYDFDPTSTDSAHYQHQYDNERVYWLTWGGTFSGNPRRMATVDATPGNPSATLVESVPERLHFETNRHHDPGPRSDAVRWEKWWWNAGYSIADGTHRAVWFELPGHVEGSQGELFVRMWGVTSSLHSVDHELNSVPVERSEWSGRLQPKDEVHTFGGAGDRFIDGRNTYTFFVTPEPSRDDVILLAFLEAKHERWLRWPATRIAFNPPDVDGALRYRVTDLPDAAAEVYDITDPKHPIRLVTTGVSGGAGTTTLEFERDEVAGSPRRYLVTHPTKRWTPVSVERDTPPPGSVYLRELRDPVDYIVVYYDDFEGAALDLAQFRDNYIPGIPDPSVLAVRLSDVLDEFAWGAHDPTGIRNFLKFAYENYRETSAPGTPRLRHVVLIGDSDLDHRDYQTSAGVDYMPAWSERYDRQLWPPWIANWPEDPYLALLDSIDDFGMEFTVGRLPAQTASQAQAMVDKTIEHTTSSDRSGWSSRAVFVADDLCQGTSLDSGFYRNWTHIRQTEEQLAVLMPPEMDIVRIYLVDYPDPITGLLCRGVTKPSARDALLAEMNEGAWLMNYVGHGGETVLSDEQVLVSGDVPGLTNDGRYFYFITASCSVGKFDDIAEGLAETILKQPGGGSVASYSSAAVAFSGQNARLNEELLKALVDTTENGVQMFTPVGQASREALLAFPTLNTRKYNLLGDPAVINAWPSQDVAIVLNEGASGDGGAPTDTLYRGEIMTVRGTIVDPVSGDPNPSFSGSARVLIYDSEELRHRDQGPNNGNEFPFNPVDYYMPGAPIYRGDHEVTNGEFRVEFVVPTGLRLGDRGQGGIISYVTADTEPDAFGVRKSLTVPDDVRPGGAVQDTIGPAITMEFDGPPESIPVGSSLRIRFEDEHGIYITQLLDSRSVVLTFEEPGGFVVSLIDLSQDIVYEDDITEAEVEVAVPTVLTVGRPYQVRVRASDNLGNRTTVAQEVFLVATTSPEVQRVFAYPNPTATQTGFFVDVNVAVDVVTRIHTLSGRRIRTLERSLAPGEGRNRPIPWDLRDDDGDVVANGSYLYVMEIRPIDGGPTDTRQGWVAVLR